MRFLLALHAWALQETLCTHLALAIYTRLLSAVPIADVTGSLGGATAAMEPVSAPDDVALICFTSGEKTRLLQNE